LAAPLRARCAGHVGVPGPGVGGARAMFDSLSQAWASVTGADQDGSSGAAGGSDGRRPKASPQDVAAAAKTLCKLLLPVAQAPFVSHCQDFATLLEMTRGHREPIAEAVDRLLFDPADGSVGAGENGHGNNGWRILLRRSPNDVSVEVAPAPGAAAPAGDMGARLAGADGAGAVRGNAMLETTHTADAEGVSDFLIEQAIACGPGLHEFFLDVIARVAEVLVSFVDGSENPDAMGEAFRRVCPHLTEFYEDLFDLEAIVVKKNSEDENVAWMETKLPFARDKMQGKYDGFRTFLEHVEQLSIVFRHPETHNEVVRMVLTDSLFEVNLATRDGQVAWENGGPLGCPGTLVITSIRPDDEAAEVAIKEAGVAKREEEWRSILGDVGASAMMSMEYAADSAQSAMGSAVDAAAALVFDVHRFRELLIERYRFEATYRHSGGAAAGAQASAARAASSDSIWLLGVSIRFAVPTTKVMAMFITYARDFVKGQMQRLHGLRLGEQLLRATLKDRDSVLAYAQAEGIALEDNARKVADKVGAAAASGAEFI